MGTELGYWDRFKNFASAKNIANIGKTVQDKAKGIVKPVGKIAARGLVNTASGAKNIIDSPVGKSVPLVAAVGAGVGLGKGIELVAGGADDALERRYKKMSPQQKKVHDMTSEQYNQYSKTRDVASNINNPATKIIDRPVQGNGRLQDVAPAAKTDNIAKLKHNDVSKTDKTKLSDAKNTVGSEGKQPAVSTKNDDSDNVSKVELDHRIAAKKVADDNATSDDDITTDDIKARTENRSKADSQNKFFDYLSNRKSIANDSVYAMTNGDVHNDGNEFKQSQLDIAKAKGLGISESDADELMGMHKSRQSK